MSDYLNKINTALDISGEGIYYESLEDVRADLENKKQYHHDKAIDYATYTAMFTGTGLASQLIPEISKAVASDLPLSGDQVANIALTGGLAFSIYPTWKANRHRNEYKEIGDLIEAISEGRRKNSADLAYEVAGKLS